MNLGIAYLALNQYQNAEEAFQKASSIAPLDISFLQALAYGQFVNKNYAGVIATSNQVHKRKHEGAAAVHYFAAAAWEAQNNSVQAQRELEILLREDPKFPAADDVRQLLQDYKARSAQSTKQEVVPAMSFSFSNEGPTSKEASEQGRRILQELKEKQEIAEAEAAEESAMRQSSQTLAAMATIKPTETGTLVRPGGVFLGRQPCAPDSVGTYRRRSLRAGLDSTAE